MKEENNKRKEAIALKYDSNKNIAPYVAAKGKGLIADKIMEKAKEFEIPIQEDPSLLSLLGHLEIHQSIPDDLYEAVAEIFAFIYRVDQQQAEKKTR